MKRSKIISLIIGILLLFFLIIRTSGCSRTKVRTNEFNSFTKEVIGKNHIKKMNIESIRWALFIDFDTDENFDKKDLANVMDKLKPLINVKHMKKITERYWIKDFQINTIYVSFYTGDQDRDNVTINRKYYLYTLYRKKQNGYDIPENIDGFQTWFIAKDGKVMLLQDYLDGKHPQES